MSNINLFRLNSGEEILAECDLSKWSQDEHGFRAYEIKNPIIIIPIGEGKIALAPWIPYCETSTMLIPTSSILFTAVPKKTLTENYMSTVSGIVMPSPAVSKNLRLISE
jgi:hypothetical protein